MFFSNKEKTLSTTSLVIFIYIKFFMLFILLFYPIRLSLL